MYAQAEEGGEYADKEDSVEAKKPRHTPYLWGHDATLVGVGVWDSIGAEHRDAVRVPDIARVAALRSRLQLIEAVGLQESNAVVRAVLWPPGLWCGWRMEEFCEKDV